MQPLGRVSKNPMLFPTLAKSAVSQVKILFTLSLAVFTAARGKVQTPQIGPNSNLQNLFWQPTAGCKQSKPAAVKDAVDDSAIQ